MDQDQLTIEQTRLEIEKKKLEIELEKLSMEKDTSKRYFGVILTAIVSILLGFFSYMQFNINSNQTELNIRLQEDDRAFQRNLQARDFKKKAELQESEFVLKTAEFIFSQQLILFPDDLGDEGAKKKFVCAISAIQVMPNKYALQMLEKIQISYSEGQDYASVRGEIPEGVRITGSVISDVKKPDEDPAATKEPNAQVEPNVEGTAAKGYDENFVAAKEPDVNVVAQKDQRKKSEIKVFIQYRVKKDEEIAEKVHKELKAEGFNVQKTELIESEKLTIPGDVRYFHSEDESYARLITSEVKKKLSDEKKPGTLTLLDLSKPYGKSVPLGTIEIWLPK